MTGEYTNMAFIYDGRIDSYVLTSMSIDAAAPWASSIWTSFWNKVFEVECKLCILYSWRRLTYQMPGWDICILAHRHAGEKKLTCVIPMHWSIVLWVGDSFRAGAESLLFPSLTGRYWGGDHGSTLSFFWWSSISFMCSPIGLLVSGATPVIWLSWSWRSLLYFRSLLSRAIC